ncbi:Uncharacterized protein TCAP_07422 [Tolypocladium capitatum]|uniref:Uncharacterized protein n=1 Tax=Tolypocladium capitatum TaxID=45235 RepID=A0A2K3PYP1_9HYPO|nr:Uncharacterized protein TCAP_07422 [Tolypocladium capitatum]
MAPRLDLSRPDRTRVVVAPPRISLRRTASYTHQERASVPRSATSSRFSFNHLLFSPPPSPRLPAPVPPPKHSSSHIFTTRRPRRLVRLLVYFTGLVAALHLVAFVFWNRNALPAAFPHAEEGHGEFDMVAHDVLPDFPTPIVVAHGRKPWKWTVSIPRDYDFPLSIGEYAEMSGRCREASAHARRLHHKTPLSDDMMLARDDPDDHFVDVQEADRAGLLPGAGGVGSPKRPGHFVGLDWEAMAAKPVCESSLTYALETPEAGIGASLMTLWTLYALAKDQGRAFFVDDSRWAYGAYADMFQAPPAPDCRPPPRHRMVPCPVQARHLVVSSVTAEDAFPALLAKHRRDTGAGAGQRHLLELARTGYRALFKLTQEDQDYVDKRIEELQGIAKAGGTTSPHAPVIGLHIRRGDQHPFEYQYRDTYIPAEVFLAQAERLAETHHGDAETEGVKPKAVTVIASDDPMVHTEPDFSDAHVAQQRIRLASKEAIERANPDPHVLHRFVEEAHGWDGGFFAPTFWNLGAQRKNSAAATAGDGPEPTEPPSEQTLRLRSFVGRAYMMDLAVLAGASDKVVCAVSAMGCRMLGVMMGWERAVEKGDWVNVDGGYGWGGLGW